MSPKSHGGEILDESEWDMDRWVPAWQGGTAVEEAPLGAPSSGSPWSPALAQPCSRTVRSKRRRSLPHARHVTRVHS